MTDRSRRQAEGDRTDGAAGVRAEPAVTEGIATTDAYEVEDGVVLFDIENPLAWLEADRAVPVTRMA